MRYDLTASNERLRRALVPEYQKPPRAKTKKPLCCPSSPLFLAGGALFAAIACFGLFLGFFLPSPLGSLIAGGEPIFRGSLFGVLVEILRGSIAPPSLPAGGGILGSLPFLLYCACLAAAVAALLSTALSACAFVRVKAARALCTANGALVLLAYGTLFLLGAIGGAADFSVALPFLCACALLSLLTLLRRGAEGIFRVLLLACSLLPAGAFAFPATPLLPAPGELFPLTAKSGCLLALMGVTALNVLFSVLLCGSRGGGWTVRFSLQTACAVALAAVYFSADGAAFFTSAPVPCLLLLLPPLAGIFLSVAARTLFPRKAQPKKEAGNQAADS